MNKPYLIFIYFLIFFLFVLQTHNKVSYQNLKLFFRYTYDQNGNQQITWKEFCDYFKFMEPQHQFSFDVFNYAFDALDFNQDGILKLQQFVDHSDINFQVKIGHKQIHLGFTQNQRQMQVMWVSTPQSYQHPVVFYGQYPSKLNQIQNATSTTYNVGHIGFHGSIYRAVMKNLKPGQRYYYKVGDVQTQTFSQLKFFKAPPKRNTSLQQVRFAIFGDMGTYAPFGHMVSKMLTSKNNQKFYDFVFLTGDIAYAGMQSQAKGELQPIWDLFGQQSQKFAAYTAFMPGVGNHQAYYNFTSYLKRYRLPRIQQNQTNLWFSFDYGQVHIVYFSSEHPYGVGSQQYNFLDNDLRKARQNPNIKWIIFGAHRPFYSSDARGYQPITNLTKSLEDLIKKYKVDIVQNGHQHSYQRTWPVYQGKAQKQNHNQKYYVNPQAPIYVVQGTAGALVRDKWIDPSPQWSLRRIKKYGYGQVTVKANYLKYQFISLPVGKVVDTWYIIKDKNAKIEQNQLIVENDKEI